MNKIIFALALVILTTTSIESFASLKTEEDKDRISGKGSLKYSTHVVEDSKAERKETKKEFSCDIESNSGNPIKTVRESAKTISEKISG